MKQLFILLLLLCSVGMSAQDVIVKKDGSTIVCRVVELNSSEIVYKKWTDLNGSNYVMNRADASAINYGNGKKENISEVTNLYTPNNQNDGTQMFNDRALLQMDYENQGLSRKAKKMRTIGIIGGGVLLGIGAICFIADGGITSTPYFIGGIGCAIGAVAWTSGFLIAAHNKQRRANRLQAASIYQQEFMLKNGTSLTPSVDLIKDQASNFQTIGLGLSYNF